MDIKELRQKLRMTQKEFGEYLNIPQRTIQSWELGDRTPPEYVFPSPIGGFVFLYEK